MDQFHARYPFLRSAREAVSAAEVDLAAVIEHEQAVVNRAMERIETALEEGAVGPPRRQGRVEVLSYPVARVLVSLVDEYVLTRKYTRAEATTARDRLDADRQGSELKSSRRRRLTLADLLAEFDLSDDVSESADGYQVGVGTYLRLSADRPGEDWRLVNRELADGVVPVSREELLSLVGEAVRHRVADGLPLTVPDVVATELDDEQARIRELLADLELTRDIDTVVPEMFPPCMTHLLDQIQKGNHLEHHSRFAIASFLTSIGLSTDEIVELFKVNPGFGEDVTRYQVDHIRGATSSTEYSPPSCATMQSYGDCVNMDDRCETISHPLSYYGDALDDADEGELVDWRERQTAESD